MTTPDTTEAVADALDDIEQFYYNGAYRLPANTYEVALAAIAADRKALAEQGYVIVRRKNLSDYINQHHYVVDGEWGSSRSIKKLMLDGAVNEDYRLFGLL